MHIGGATHYGFFQFLPIKELCHPKRVSLTKDDNIQDMPKRENNHCHKTLYDQ